MGDTQMSQTISTKSREIARTVACNSRPIEWGQPPVLTGGSSLIKIELLAQSNPELVFTSVVHRIDFDLLKQSFRKIRKSKSAGVDKVTAKEYAENLDQNLYNLYERLRRGQYVASPVKRIWIDKEGGKKRPIGIPVLEDKIVQKAAAAILNVIFDRNFYNFSHAFRKGRSQHMAIKDLREQCLKQNISWIVSADITGLFDNINHELLKDMIRRRVSDGGMIRLIGKWLNAGVMEEGNLTYSETGTPQGGVISPVLSNIFLHYVLDDWYVKEVIPRMKGRCSIIRWADDFILGFEYEKDALRVMDVLPRRFEQFELSLHPEKTKLIRFSKRISGKGNGTFDFLGFTFYWSKSLKGYMVIKKKTARKRSSRFMKRIWIWCKDNRHKPMAEQYEILCSKLRGFYQYFGVISNYKVLEVVFEYTEKAWRRWLSRRSHKGEVMFEDLRTTYPLPLPRIVHNI
ncbi:group II intron reverse transcriptase/maturase [Desulfosarcina sp. BuS5]|uniref:group II intron reverse transcriptase/maturase n=3 Tax=Bacteria TaxID=2 RepID=UPI0005642520|nr:group II intron reverse transcriptase/maturase [Desulfosarcina sp. BuS5]